MATMVSLSVLARFSGSRFLELLFLVSLVLGIIVVGSTEAFVVIDPVPHHGHPIVVSVPGGFGVASVSTSASRMSKKITSATTHIIKTRTSLAYNNDRSTTATTTTTTNIVPKRARHPPWPSNATSQILAPSQNNNDLLVDGGTGSSPCQHDEEQLRHQLKDALSIAAIEEYDMDAYNAGMTTMAEEYMKCLEEICPWPTPAYHSQLNARWSFVFTGVPTIGMKLITLLSRISVGIPILEFDNVFLEVSKNQSQVKAIVKVLLWGNPIELNVYTRLSRPNYNNNNGTASCGSVDDVDDYEDKDHGTLLIETFDKLVLMGHEIPTPASWKSSRKLHITYLDDDMMIARTNGGEPHLLLRHSPCGTDDDTCDLDTEDPTPFFQEAMNKYGRHLSRSLVDRAYTIHSETKGTLDLANIVRLIHGIISSPNEH